MIGLKDLITCSHFHSLRDQCAPRRVHFRRRTHVVEDDGERMDPTERVRVGTPIERVQLVPITRARDSTRRFFRPVRQPRRADEEAAAPKFVDGVFGLDPPKLEALRRHRILMIAFEPPVATAVDPAPALDAAGALQHARVMRGSDAWRESARVLQPC